MKPFYIVVNPVGSKFAKALQSAIKESTPRKVLRTGRSSVKHNGREFVVTPRVLNKIEQFNKFKEHEISIPRFSTDPDAVTRGDLGRIVFARTLVNSTGGRGIKEIDLDNSGDVIPRAPLYTEYIKKKYEYRIHVFHGKVIDIQQKKKKREFNQDDRDTRVRNLVNGYVYCRDGVAPPADAIENAIRAVSALGYKYGAVDVVYNERQNKSFVLEVNSRPGLMGTTLDKYSSAIINEFKLRA